MSDYQAVRDAINAMDMEQARILLRPLLQQNPTAETYYLAALVALSVPQRRQFLQKALELDPFHVASQQELNRLAKAETALTTRQPVGFPATSGSQPVLAAQPISLTPPPSMSVEKIGLSAVPTIVRPMTAPPPKTFNPLFIIPMIGAVMMVVGCLLPWISLALRNNYTSLQYSVNGVGIATGSTSVGTGGLLQDINRQGGLIVLGLSVLIIVLGSIGISQHQPRLAGSIALAGFAALGLAVFELLDLQKIISGLVMVSSYSSGSGGTRGLANGVGSANIGFGIYLVLAGAGLALLGSAIASRSKFN